MSEVVRICASCWEEDCVCDYERYVDIDSGFVDVIKSLNLKGYKTMYCCEGHIDDDDGDTRIRCFDMYISLARRVENLPEGFVISPNKNSRDFHRTIRYRYKNGELYARVNGKYIPFDLAKDKEIHIDNIRKWIENLPKIDMQKYPECYSDYLVTGKPYRDPYKSKLDKLKGYRVRIEEEGYGCVSKHIAMYGGRIIDTEERNYEIDIVYWAERNLFVELEKIPDVQDFVIYVY